MVLFRTKYYDNWTALIAVLIFISGHSEVMVTMVHKYTQAPVKSVKICIRQTPFSKNLLSEVGEGKRGGHGLLNIFFKHISLCIQFDTNKPRLAHPDNNCRSNITNGPLQDQNTKCSSSGLKQQMVLLRTKNQTALPGLPNLLKLFI